MTKAVTLSRETWIRERMLVLNTLLTINRQNQEEPHAEWVTEYDALFQEWQQLNPKARTIYRANITCWFSQKKGRVTKGFAEIATYDGYDERIGSVYIQNSELKALGLGSRMGVGMGRKIDEWLETKDGLQYLNRLFADQKGLTLDVF